MAANYVWTWTTGATADTTPPTVIATNPANLATNVCINKGINATFSEAMDATTISATTFTLTAGATNIGGLLSYDSVTSLASFVPSANLAPTTQYTATVVGGVNGVKDVAGNAMVADKVTTFTTGSSACAAAPPLGAAAPMGNMGGTAGATSAGLLTVINGDMSSTATATGSITGFHDSNGDIYTETPLNVGSVTGRIYSCTVSTTGPSSGAVVPASCTIAQQALADAQTAYTSLQGAASVPAPYGGQLAGQTVPPGVYKAAAGYLITGADVTLDGGGDANAVWIFQMPTTLTVGASGAPRIVNLINGAQAKNVFWAVGSSATINPGGGGTMVGTIIAQAGVSFSTAGTPPVTTLNGRAVGLTASVTMVNTVVNVPAP